MNASAWAISTKSDQVATTVRGRTRSRERTVIRSFSSGWGSSLMGGKPTSTWVGGGADVGAVIDVGAGSVAVDDARGSTLDTSSSGARWGRGVGGGGETEITG